MTTDAVELKNRYDTIAQSRDYRTTACDYNLRELEIDTGSSYMQDGHRVLDVGCGLGYAVVQYALRHKVDAIGIDYSQEMIVGATDLFRETHPDVQGTVKFEEASVLNLPYEAHTFDVVTSSRCLMALLDWELQKQALVEIARVLKPGGRLILMEGTFEGLDKLNEGRAQFGLAAIAPDGRDRLFTLKFHEQELLDFCSQNYETERIQRFGMYYFLTRIVQPLLVAPDPPRYDHKLNEIAKIIARVYPDFEGMGHLVAFVLRRKGDQ